MNAYNVTFTLEGKEVEVTVMSISKDTAIGLVIFQNFGKDICVKNCKRLCEDNK